jgi:[acyl-carrier-protein] S-malonyltransferase
MLKAKLGLESAVNSLEFKDPSVPIIANSDCTHITKGDQVKEELVSGLCQCVQWKDSVKSMVNAGVSQFVEFGPVGVLSGLIRRIDRGVQTTAITDPDSISKLAERKEDGSGS